MAGCRIILALISLTLLIAGCSDTFTYGRQSRDRALQYMSAEQFVEAKGAFRDAVRQNPRDYQSYHYLGVLDAREKSYASAINNFRTSMRVQDAGQEGREDVAFKLKTIGALAQTLAESDKRDQEINDLEKQAEQSKTGDEYLVLAKTFVARGDADSAMMAYEQAIRKSPNTFYIAKERGLYLEQIGQRALAESALRRAYQLNDQDPEVQSALRRLGVVPGPALKTN